MLVSTNGATFGFAGETLFKNVKFSLNEGDRVGLIGGNGEGKTTLLRLILGEITPENGEFYRKNNAKFGYLPQNGGYASENTVYEEMLAVFEEDRRAIERLREVERQIATTEEGSREYAALVNRYESLNRQISARDSYNAEVRIRTVLNGMGFEKNYTQRIATMSGGEKTRLKLCRLLLEAPDLLILDEPTNHLDMKTLFWLEEYLASYKGALLVVSHDRYFLDKTVKEIYELENKTLSVFKGNYSKYKILKAERNAALLKEYEKQQAERAHMQEYVDKNLVRASTTKMAQSRRRALEKMELIEKPFVPPQPPRFSFFYAERPYEKILEVKNLTLFAGEKKLFDDAEFEITRGEKCALVGDNGAGKTTLLKELYLGKNPAVRQGRFVKIAYYDQENANLDGSNTVLAELWNRHSLWEQTKVRKLLAQAGLPAEDVDKKVSMLSGGERAKLALAVFAAENGNVLFLDEPTNHLDLPARESLEESLKAFDGTILFVSHDRYFINALAGKILEIENGKLTAFVGSYERFTEAKRNQTESVQRVPAPEKPKDTGSYRSKEERARQARAQTRLKQIEREIEALEGEEQALQEELSTPAVAADFTLLSEKCKRIEEIHQTIDALYEEYETLL